MWRRAKAIGCTNWQDNDEAYSAQYHGRRYRVFSMGMGGAILAEATLSFLGFGIPPPAPSWGGMLSGPARRYMLQAPWMALWPGLALSLVVYGMNMLGDGLRDILDPVSGAVSAGTATPRPRRCRRHEPRDCRSNSFGSAITTTHNPCEGH